MHPPSSPLDMSGIIYSKHCAVCQLSNWHAPFFLWIHEAVIVKGLSIPKIHVAVNEQLKVWNSKNPDNQRPLLMVDTLHIHFREHIPQTWNDMARISSGWKANGLIRPGSGEMEPDIAAQIEKFGTEADAALVSDLGRITSVIDRVYKRFEEFDKDIIGPITQDKIPGYTKLASLLTSGLDSLIKIRNQDKILQASLTHFADRFAATAVDLLLPELGELERDIAKRGHPEIANLVAIRVRDIVIRSLVRSAKDAITDARQNMKSVG